MTKKKIKSILKRLWKYHSIYFLKPHDAINDTLTSSLLDDFDWSGEILEIGSGDGVYSYIMHDGSLPLSFDRYLDVDLQKKDIFEKHTKKLITPKKKVNFPNIFLSIDAKVFHAEKIKEINFSKDALVSRYEQLPIKSSVIQKIFYYTPHGLKDHDQALKECLRILKDGGKLIILLYDSEVKNSFIFYRLSNLFAGALGSYFKKMDNDRFMEISNLSRTKNQWLDYFNQIGFSVENTAMGLSPLAWKFYDIQTRTILRSLVKIFSKVSGNTRKLMKMFWMLIFYPYLVIFYILFSNQVIRLTSKNCYIAFELKKL